MKISQKKEASLQDTHILIIIFFSIFWFSDNQDLGNLIKIYNTGEILFFSPGVNFILGYMPYPTHQTLACHIASKNSMLFSHRAIQDFCSFPPTTTHFHTFFFPFCMWCMHTYLPVHGCLLFMHAHLRSEADAECPPLSPSAFLLWRQGL